MDVFAALEERVEKLITSYGHLAQRVAELEEENRKLKTGGDGATEMAGRIAELEGERNEVRARLEKLLATLSALEL